MMRHGDDFPMNCRWTLVTLAVIGLLTAASGVTFGTTVSAAGAVNGSKSATAPVCRCCVKPQQPSPPEPEHGSMLGIGFCLLNLGPDMMANTAVFWDRSWCENDLPLLNSWFAPIPGIYYGFSDAFKGRFFWQVEATHKRK